MRKSLEKDFAFPSSVLSQPPTAQLVSGGRERDAGVMDRLVRMDVKELNLPFRRGQPRSSAKFRVENLMHTMSVAVCVCTTNPDAFSVKPSSLFIIPPLSSTTFSLSITAGDDASGTDHRCPVLSFPQDKLCVKSSMLPTGKADDDRLCALFSEFGTHVYNDASVPITFTGEDVARSIISWEHRNLNDLSVSVLLAKAVSDCTPSQIAELLRTTCRSGRTQFVSTLIDAGADVNAKDALGVSALALAVVVGNGECVRVLLSAGATVDPSVRKFLCSPESLSRVDVVAAFVSAGAFDVNGTVDSLDRTPLHLCSIQGNLDTLSFCVAMGGDVDRVDLHGWTPLHYAAAEGHLDIVRFLLDVCHTKYASTPDGRTPHALAMESGHHHVSGRLCIEEKLYREVPGLEERAYSSRGTTCTSETIHHLHCKGPRRRLLAATAGLGRVQRKDRRTSTSS